ncbi:hypothetical protein Hanom_Chr17g01551591 [Helianthus anomalus]
MSQFIIQTILFILIIQFPFFSCLHIWLMVILASCWASFVGQSCQGFILSQRLR